MTLTFYKVSPLAFFDLMDSKVVAVFLFVCALSAHGLSPDDEVCQSIVQAASSSVDPVCQPLGDCTGISCQSTQPNMTVVVAVDKCTDPLQVNITVTDGQAVVVLESTVTSASDLQNNDYTIDTFTRDDQAFTISMSYDNNGQNQVAIPSTEIPLNASDCTCSAINYIKDNHEAPGDNDPCIINDACNGLECFLNLGGMELSVEIEIVACGDSPGFIFILRDSEPNVLGEFFFTEDRNVTLAGTVPMDVKVEHGDYSMTISAEINFGTKYKIIPETKVILDKSLCIEPSSVMQMTVGPTPSPFSIVVSPETCQAIKDIRDVTNSGGFSTCTVNDACDTLTCLSYSTYVTSFQLLQCITPPSVHVIMTDHEGLVYDNVIHQSTNVEIRDTGSVMIVTLQQKQDAIAMKVDVDLGLGPFPIILLHDIPLNTSYIYCQPIVSTTPTITSAIGTLSTSTTKETNTGVSSEVVAIAVTIPLVLVFVIAVMVVAIVVVLFIAKNRTAIKTRKPYEESIAVKDMKYLN